jgi:hypothetical protein
MNVKLIPVLFGLAALAASPLPAASKRLPAIVGRSIQIDPDFPYYQNRSADSIAWEMKANGYRIVRYVVTNDGRIRDDLIRAFHKQGIAVWYQTGGNGFYTVGKPEPKNWQEWRMAFAGPYPKDEEYQFISMSHPNFIAWKRGKIVEVATHHAFDGVEIAEPFQMGWGGPEGSLYGDLSPAALRAFTAWSGYKEPPEFKDAASPRYYKTDNKRYAKWQDFRVHAVAAYLNAVVNGPGGLRKKCPGVLFCAWALANTSPSPGRNPAELMREWQGMDAVAIARVVNPDMMCFQTNWPDWSTPELPGDYPKQYRPFTDPFKAALPRVPFIVQADIGSQTAMRRSREWIATFENACKEIGTVGSTAYMYDIALWMYTEPPQVRIAVAKGTGILLVFQKCVDPKTAGDANRYHISDANGRAVAAAKATVDGNLVHLTTSRLTEGNRYTVAFEGVRDDPARWLEKGQPANEGTQSLNVTAR